MPVAAPPSAREDLVERARQLRRLADELEAQAGGRRGDVAGDAAEAVECGLRGDNIRARALATQTEVRARGDVDTLAIVAFARAVTWMSEGHCHVAFDALCEQLDSAALSPQARSDLSGTFAELAVRTNRVDEARRTLQPWRDCILALPAAARREFGLAELLLTEADPIGCLEGALAASWSPLTLARIHLALGMALRRGRHPRDSRPHLLIAVDLLTEENAVPWLTLARNELRAAGVRDRSGQNAVALSAQENAIVELAAQGLSNREIGERLYLSPRTVGSHLYRVFPKLGVTSRHQLPNL